MENPYYTHDTTAFGGQWPFITDSGNYERRLYIHLREGETPTSHEWVDDYRIINPGVVRNIHYYDDSLTCFACSTVREYNVEETGGDQYSVSAVICSNVDDVYCQLREQYNEVNNWAGVIVFRVIWLPSTWEPHPTKTND